MEEIDIKEIFDIFWHRKAQIILAVLIFAVMGAIYTIQFVKPQYTSLTKLVLVQSDNKKNVNAQDAITASDVVLNAQLVSTYSDIIRSKSVVRQVISNLDLELPEDSVRNSIKVTAVEDTELIQITVTNKNPLYAMQIANETTKVFTEEVGKIYKLNNVYVLDKAEIPMGPSNINHYKDVILFAGVGLAIALICAFVSSLLDTTIKTAEDVEKKVKAPVLASIPKYDFK